MLNIIDKETAEGPDAKTKAVGTGPFTFVEWAQGQHLKFAKNPNYWQSGRPYLDGVIVNIKADAQAMVTELEAGASDVILAPTWRDFGRLKADPRYQTIKVAQPSTFHQFQPNVTFKPLDNKLVRQALSYAIDRKRMVDSVFLGETTPESLPWLPSSPAYRGREAELLHVRSRQGQGAIEPGRHQQSDHRPVYTTSDPAYAQMGEIYNSDLAKIGVTLTLKTLAIAQLLDTIQKQTYNGLYTLNDPWANMEPITLFTSSSSAQHKKNNAGYKNDQYTEMVNTVATEPDAAKRKALYCQAQRLPAGRGLPHAGHPEPGPRDRRREREEASKRARWIASCSPTRGWRDDQDRLGCHQTSSTPLAAGVPAVLDRAAWPPLRAHAAAAALRPAPLLTARRSRAPYGRLTMARRCSGSTTSTG